MENHLFPTLSPYIPGRADFYLCSPTTHPKHTCMHIHMQVIHACMQVVHALAAHPSSEFVLFQFELHLASVTSEPLA